MVHSIMALSITIKNNAQHNEISITILIITLLSVMTLSITIKNARLSIMTFSIMTLNTE